MGERGKERGGGGGGGERGRWIKTVGEWRERGGGEEGEREREREREGERERGGGGGGGVGWAELRTIVQGFFQATSENTDLDHTPMTVILDS